MLLLKLILFFHLFLLWKNKLSFFFIIISYEIKSSVYVAIFIANGELFSLSEGLFLYNNRVNNQKIKIILGRHFI